jgi:hypothetical protein
VGKEEASGSPWISSLPENLAIHRPSRFGSKKESCFSAVRPVSGWKTWVKCVAPRASAHSFIASATASASEMSSASPCSSVAWSFSYTSPGSTCCWTAGEKTLAPKGLLSSLVRSTVPRASPFGLQVAEMTFCARVLSIVGAAS